jgi:hypoxia-inducible factor (prolyl hydroxylase)
VSSCTLFIYWRNVDIIIRLIYVEEEGTENNTLLTKTMSTRVLTTKTVCVECSSLKLPRKCADCEKDEIQTSFQLGTSWETHDTVYTVEQLANNVLEKLTHQGYCVVDKFHKEEKALTILNEVKNIHAHGEMHNGELASTLPSENVRGDIIKWVDGKTKGTENIAGHMCGVDALLRELNKIMPHHRIEGRTQAMVACYPGGEKRYRKHVDNPNQDGRCITTLYYLNKDYDRTVDGGVFRLYPNGGDAYVDIEPILDRLILFWSDRRNPHEVLPAHKTRYAITLWYFDKEEREEECQRLKKLKEMRESRGRAPMTF